MPLCANAISKREVLPDLQSLIVVLWKELFQNVSALVTSNGPNGMTNGVEDSSFDAAGKRKTNPNSSASLSAMANGLLLDSDETNDLAVENLNDTRSREISAKAVSGILLLLLKWFKLSRKSV